MLSRSRCAAVALLAVALAYGWQRLTVHYNYGGNWTALFTTAACCVPSAPEFSGTYTFPSTGYDGQLYRQIAHDPLGTRGVATSIDAPRLRYRRILVPGLAYLAALGRPGWIDTAYYAVMLAFLFAGVYWTARWAVMHRRHPAWGLALAVVPAVPVSLDRMTVDLALVALCCAWALYAAGRNVSWKNGALLAALPLARETGLLVTLASAAGSSEQPWKRRVPALAATLVPFALWNFYLNLHTRPDATPWFGYVPFTGIVRALWSGPAEPAGLPLRVPVIALDYAAVVGIAAAIVLAIRAWLKSPRGAFEMALLFFAVLAIQTGRADVWTHVFSFGRVFSPLLLLLGLRALATRDVLAAVPLVLTLPRVLVQFAPQVLGIVNGLR